MAYPYRHDSIYMKRPDQANLQKQEVAWWLPGAGARVNGKIQCFFWGCENILECTHKLANISKPSELYALKGQIFGVCVFVSWGCHNELPLLGTAEMYFLTALESRSPKGKFWQGHTFPEVSRGNLPQPFSASGGHGCSLCLRSVVPVSVTSFPVCLCMFPLSFLPIIKPSVTGFRVHPQSRIILF